MGFAYRTTMFVLVLAATLPLQWLALKLKLPLLRTLPVWFHRTVLKILNIRVEVLGVPSEQNRPLLFVSNHASWLDIVVLGSTGPLCFIAKSEIANWPLFGTFARLQRSIFVDRSRRHGTGQVNKSIARTLSGGDPVVLFGEGTSSDGNRVLQFRSALLGGLRDAMEENGRGFVQPVAIAYRKFHGIPMGRRHREVAAWYGDMDLLPHLLRVLKEGAIDVTVAFGKVMEVAHEDDRKTLSRNVESTVRTLASLSLAGRPELLTDFVCLARERR
jgi:1-acyl-sn-glycerol-3-phosphate acyltransferase